MHYFSFCFPPLAEVTAARSKIQEVQRLSNEFRLVYAMPPRLRGGA